MVDVEAYHILHREKTSESEEEGSLLSERSLKRLRNTKEFQLQLPPTIQGFNMTEKKWSKFRCTSCQHSTNDPGHSSFESRCDQRSTMESSDLPKRRDRRRVERID